MRGLALLATLSGGVLALGDAWRSSPGRAEGEGLRVRLERSAWVHEPMDHGGAATLPALEGLPAPGQRRLAVTLSLFNARGRPQDFAPGEVRLTEETTGREWPPVGTAAPITLHPAQGLSLTLGFDVPRTSSPLRLDWARGGERAALLVTWRPSREEPEGWPRRVEALPPGDAAAGAALFRGRLACGVCHGDPEAPGESRLAPALHALVRVGATRVPGTSAAQYAYESLLDPNAFIVPECAPGRPCARPSTMPLYGEVVSPQEMADLVRYLVSPRSAE